MSAGGPKSKDEKDEKEEKDQNGLSADQQISIREENGSSWQERFRLLIYQHRT